MHKIDQMVSKPAIRPEASFVIFFYVLKSCDQSSLKEAFHFFTLQYVNAVNLLLPTKTNRAAWFFYCSNSFELF